MSLYDGLDLDARAGPVRGSSDDLSGWGSSLKVLETQKQLQAKKYVLQNVKRKSEGTVLAPVIDLKGRKGDVPGELRFNQITGKLEAVTSLTSFVGSDAPTSFSGVKDEYDPMKPNEYESFTKLVRDMKTRERDDSRRGRQSDERESRRGERRRGDDEEEETDDNEAEYTRSRRERQNRGGDRDSSSSSSRNRDHRKDDVADDDEGEFERRRRKRGEEEENEDRSQRGRGGSGAAIAPPPALMDLDIPTPEFLLQKQAAENKQDQNGALPGTKFGMGGSVASKIMAKMGYREGQGLGKSEQGMSIALQVEKTSKRGGKIIHEKDLAKMQEPAQPVATPSASQQLPLKAPEVSNANLLRNPSKVIILQNMVGPGEVDDELEGETAEECQKYGKVIKCVIFEIPGAIEEEAVRIFLEFERLESAIKAVVDLNGRYFGGRIVKGNFYNLDKFRHFDLADPVD